MMISLPQYPLVPKRCRQGMMMKWCSWSKVYEGQFWTDLGFNDECSLWVTQSLTVSLLFLVDQACVCFISKGFYLFKVKRCLYRLNPFPQFHSAFVVFIRCIDYDGLHTIVIWEDHHVTYVNVLEMLSLRPVVMPSMCLCVCAGVAGCASPQTRTTGQQSGCGRAAAVAQPSGCTRPACNAGWMRSSVATPRPGSPAHNAMQNTSSSSQNSVQPKHIPPY